MFENDMGEVGATYQSQDFLLERSRYAKAERLRSWQNYGIS